MKPISPDEITTTKQITSRHTKISKCWVTADKNKLIIPLQSISSVLYIYILIIYSHHNLDTDKSFTIMKQGGLWKI